MGDLLKNIGVGGGRENAKVKNNYIGENTNQSPLEDILGLLASETNQQRAQRNLLWGGAGYGGSFESKDQEAARAAGGSLNPKPYGGWGGYGSDNKTMYPGAVPAVQPVGGSGDGAEDIPIDSEVPVSQPQSAPVPLPQGTPVGTGGHGVKLPDNSGNGMSIENFIAALQQYAQAQAVPQAAATPANGRSPEKQAAIDNSWYGKQKADPGVQKTVALIDKAGGGQLGFGSSGGMMSNIKQGLSAGLTPEQIAGHYASKAAQYGGDWAKANAAGHGSAWQMNDDVIAGLKAGRNMGPTGWADPAWGENGAAEQPAPPATPKGASLPTGKAAPMGYGVNSVANVGGVPEQNMVAYVPQSEEGQPAPAADQPPPFDWTTLLGPQIGAALNSYQASLKDETPVEGENPDPNGGPSQGGGATGGQDVDRPQRPSQFGPQGSNPDSYFNTTTQKWETLDPAKQIAGEGYAVGDAWSTGAGWRPEEPTGGLYGAYSEMAGGSLTPYENSVLEGWKGQAENPMGRVDTDALAAIKDYTKTPGRGENEAYGAYNDMLSSGYSPEEQNAITQEGMLAARAGYETNRDAMLRNQARTGNSAGYAANMAKMARGFSETMGSQARQNQIAFADEAQKRKETGASGMTNVAGIGNQRTQYGLSAQQAMGNDLSGRKQTALAGQQSAAGYGRNIQQQGLAGLHAMLQGSDPVATLSQAANVASKPRETYTEGGSASGGI